MMKNKTKSFLVILFTLIIGIAIGFEISEILIKKRFDEFKYMRQPRGFVNIFDNIIKPDNEQKPVVDSIVRKLHIRVEKFMEAGRKQIEKEMDSLRAELKPVLRKDQLERFDNEIKRIKKGPPPMPPGGVPGMQRPGLERPGMQRPDIQEPAMQKPE